QAEDGIRDFHVTGVQTCALPICDSSLPLIRPSANFSPLGGRGAESDAHCGAKGALKRLALVGDSAGGGLVLATAVAARDRGLASSEERRVGDAGGAGRPRRARTQ